MGTNSISDSTYSSNNRNNHSSQSRSRSSSAASTSSTTLGLSGPISVAEPKEIDNILTQKLEECLRAFDLFESEEEMDHRVQVISTLNDLVKKWVKDISSARIPPEHASEMNAKIYTFGSFRLGVHTKGSYQFLRLLFLF